MREAAYPVEVTPTPEAKAQETTGAVVIQLRPKPSGKTIDTPKKTTAAKMTKTSTPGVFKRGNRYVVVFYDQAGKQRKQAARTLAEARAVKAAQTTAVRRGEFDAETRVSFADYAATWIDSYSGRTRRGVRDETRDDYRRALGIGKDGEPTGTGAVAFFGKMRLGAIRASDVKQYGEKLAEEGLARNTIRLRIAPLKALLATAAADGVIRSNPAAGVRLDRQAMGAPVKETHALTEEEVVKVLAEMPEADRPLMEFLAQTGVRISEALPLTLADVDFERGRVRIVRRLYRGGVGAPKSSYGMRVVPLSAGLAEQLKARLDGAPDDALLFPDPDGGYVDRTRLYRRVRAAGVRAGVEWLVGLHTFRHSAASIMWRRGVDVEKIRRTLGHHSWEFTSSTYVHLDDDDGIDGDLLADLVAGKEAS